MLDVSLAHVSVRSLRDVSLTFAKSTCTTIAGPPACGASTLLRVIAGDERPDAGEVRIGSRIVNTLTKAKRPLLFVTSAVDAPGRWSVEHLLVAAVRTRSLDREDRHHETQLAIDKWYLRDLLARRIDSLSSTEATRANLARIELLRPAILLADRLLERASPAAVAELADEIYRTLRVAGTTVITAPAAAVELGMCDRLVILERGAVVQEGVPAQLFREPVSEAAAIATGDVNVVPLTIRGNAVESVIGAWSVDAPPFAGSGVALVRPDDFSIAERGEESDLIFGVEDASFRDGRWHLRGFVTGGLVLKVVVPRDTPIHKGRLLPLRYDPRRFRILPV